MIPMTEFVKFPWLPPGLSQMGAVTPVKRAVRCQRPRALAPKRPVAGFSDPNEVAFERKGDLFATEEHGIHEAARGGTAMNAAGSGGFGLEGG